MSGIQSLQRAAAVSTGSYPDGGIIATSPGLGRVLYVSSVYGLNSNGGSVQDPLATIAQALVVLASSNNVQNRGDTIVCLEGHVETIASPTQLAISRAGVKVVGLGSGARQPKIVLGTAANSTITVSAADVLLQNLNIVAAFADVTAGITVSATGLNIVGCSLTESATDLNFVDFIKTGTANNVADGLTVVGSEFIGVDTANVSGINIAANTVGLRVFENIFRLGVNNAKGCISTASGKLITQADISKNHFMRLNTTAPGAAIALDGSTNTGICCDNRAVVSEANVTNLTLVFDATGLGMCENYAIGDADKSGVLSPVADS